jgi:polysaccharide biosynthesis PFTS motif protein
MSACIKKYFLTSKDKFSAYRGFRHIVQSTSAKQRIKKFIATIQSEPFGCPFSVPFTNYVLQPISIKQYLYSKLITQTFFQSINLFFGSQGKQKICFPLPAQWRKDLEDNNIKINHFLSAFFLYLVACRNYILGLIIGLKLCVRKSSKQYSDNQDSSFFDGLSDDNFPKNSESRDILNWYTRSFNVSSEIKTITHNNFNKALKIDINGFLVRYSSRLFAVEFNSVYERLKFIILYVLLSLKAFFYLIIGKIEPALMMQEMVLYIRASTIEPQKFHKEYLFHQSSVIFKPLWLDCAESAGSNAIVYFYSANIQPLFHYDLDSPVSLYTWKNYFIWNDAHKNYLHTKLHKTPRYIVSEPIYFSDNSLESIPSLNSEKKILSIFDISPVRKSYYINLGIFHEYYSFSIIKSFYEDIINIAEKLDLQILIKPKRVLNNIHHKGYAKFLSNLGQNKNIFLVNPSISADRLIEKSDLVISLPYTSTAIIAQYKNISSAFYDPSAGLKNTNNVNLIQSYEKLEKWIKEQ